MPTGAKSTEIELVEKILSDAELAEIEVLVASGVNLKDSSYAAVHAAITKNRKDVIELFKGVLLGEEENESILEIVDKFLASETCTPHEPPLKKKKKKVRCAKDGCKFSKTLYMYNCRCGSKYCLPHLNPESHECEFDYKAAGREALAAENPTVVKDKIENRL